MLRRELADVYVYPHNPTIVLLRVHRVSAVTPRGLERYPCSRVTELECELAVASTA